MAKVDQRTFPCWTGRRAFQGSESYRTVAIGHLDHFLTFPPMISAEETLALSDLDEITNVPLEMIDPDLILSPVVTPRFDCIDVAMILAQLNFSRAYRALATSLPDPGIIRREVRLLCPGLDFDILLVEPAEKPKKSSLM